MKEDFLNKTLLPALKAQAPLIQIVSYEALRVHGLVNQAAEALDMQWFSWNRIEGVKQWNKAQRRFNPAR